jgi:hypothetical protein
LRTEFSLRLFDSPLVIGRRFRPRGVRLTFRRLLSLSAGAFQAFDLLLVFGRVAGRLE